VKFKNVEGIEYEIVFRKPDQRYYGEDCDGFCTPPDKENPKIYINPHRTDQTQLNTIIHEVTHAFFWDKKEYEVKKYADTMSRLLYNKLKWRKIGPGWASKKSVAKNMDK
jgi:Zn-dependent peptidase ImmA (M78 family)